MTEHKKQLHNRTRGLVYTDSGLSWVIYSVLATGVTVLVYLYAFVFPLVSLVSVTSDNYAEIVNTSSTVPHVPNFLAAIPFSPLLVLFSLMIGLLGSVMVMCFIITVEWSWVHAYYVLKNGEENVIFRLERGVYKCPVPECIKEEFGSRDKFYVHRRQEHKTYFVSTEEE